MLDLVYTGNDEFYSLNKIVDVSKNVDEEFKTIKDEYITDVQPLDKNVINVITTIDTDLNNFYDKYKNQQITSSNPISSYKISIV
jgi:division protein CdvB (Snf7/Vps24/ESCRT-III family)